MVHSSIPASLNSFWVRHPQARGNEWVVPTNALGSAARVAHTEGRLFDMASPYLTIKEAACYLRTSTKTLRRAVVNGVLPERRVGGPRSALRFVQGDLDIYLRRGVSEVPREQVSPALSPAAQRLVGLEQGN